MFTGIVTAQGVVRDVARSEGRMGLTIDAPYEDLATGESIAVDGACLTIVDVTDAGFQVEVVTTTRGRTRFGSIEPGQKVNLERALVVGDRLGGHFVLGHVDCVGRVVASELRDDAIVIDVDVAPEIAEATIPVGSITLDGVSLTVNAMPAANIVQVSLIPFTRNNTTLGLLKVGDEVHVEADMLGKHVSQLLRASVTNESRGHDGV